MASSLAWLSTLKLTHLHAIASATGINSSGTKSLLTSRLLTELPIPRLPSSPAPISKTKPTKMVPSKPHTILSIDMGIRNLAYCSFTLPYPFSINPQSLPIIAHWNHIVISTTSTIDPLTQHQEKPTVKEQFDPPTYSSHAYTLITSLLSLTKPTTILIERQRFRSMGSSAVQEWTLRVNMFEAMLYAVLKTLSSQGAWEGHVWPVAPAKVTGFWVGDGVKEGSGSKAQKTKTMKMEMVGRWLMDGGRVQLEGKAKEMGEMYCEKRMGKRKAGKEKGEIGKLDDLADCLLQGMAWLKWEENRRKVVTDGIAVLDILDAK